MWPIVILGGTGLVLFYLWSTKTNVGELGQGGNQPSTADNVLGTVGELLDVLGASLDFVTNDVAEFFDISGKDMLHSKTGFLDKIIIERTTAIKENRKPDRKKVIELCGTNKCHPNAHGFCCVKSGNSPELFKPSNTAKTKFTKQSNFYKGGGESIDPEMLSKGREGGIYIQKDARSMMNAIVQPIITRTYQTSRGIQVPDVFPYYNIIQAQEIRYNFVSKVTWPIQCTYNRVGMNPEDIYPDNLKGVHYFTSCPLKLPESPSDSGWYFHTIEPGHTNWYCIAVNPNKKLAKWFRGKTLTHAEQDLIAKHLYYAPYEMVTVGYKSEWLLNKEPNGKHIYWSKK